MKPPAAKKKTRRRRKKNPLPPPSVSSSNPSNREPAHLDSAGDGDGGSSVATAATGEGGEGEDAPFEVVRSRKGGSFRKQKAVAVSAGMVSNFLRKDYVVGRGRKGRAGVEEEVKVKGMAGVTKDRAEQILCSVLGDDSELHLGVVRDVLCRLHSRFDGFFVVCCLKLVTEICVCLAFGCNRIFFIKFQDSFVTIFVSLQL